MGLFSFIKKQFIDVIEWTEAGDGVLSFLYPMQDREIQNGAQLTVRDSQMAMFVNEGQIADVFKPGMYTLSTKTLPILTYLKNWDKFFQSPFKSDVYFFSTRDQIDQRWGTSNPITIRDKEFGALRVRAHGVYSYRIEDPKIFYQKVSGTRDRYTAQELEGQLRSASLTSLASFLASSAISFIDMAASQTQFSDTLKTALTPPFAEFGLKLQSFLVQSITLPEEVQAYLDKSASIRMVGDLKRYAQFQAAESIPLAAKNPGGASGIGVGIGAGVALGQNMASTLNAALQPDAGGSAPVEDPIATLSKLHELLTKGVLSQAEFDAKKAELLKKIS